MSHKGKIKYLVLTVLLSLGMIAPGQSSEKEGAPVSVTETSQQISSQQDGPAYYVRTRYGKNFTVLETEEKVKKTYRLGRVAFFDGREYVPMEQIAQPAIRKKDILLKEKSEALPDRGYSEFWMETYVLHPSITAVLKENQIILKDAKGDALLKLPEPYAYDARGDTQDAIFRLEQKENNTISVFVRVDNVWLSKAAYPVVVDPTSTDTPDDTDDETFGQTNTGSAQGADMVDPNGIGLQNTGGTEIDGAWDITYADLQSDDATEGYVEKANGNRDNDGRGWLRIEWTISENEQNVQQIDFQFDGNGECLDGLAAQHARDTRFYVWDDTNSTWVDLGDSIDSTTEDTHISSVTDGDTIRDYIDSSKNINFVGWLYESTSCLGGSGANTQRIAGEYALLTITSGPVRGAIIVTE